jgi:serine/threonine-protein kinase RsbW
MTERLRLTSALEHLDAARAWLTAHCAHAGLSAQDAHALELALTEALANVVRHAYDNRAGEGIEVSFDVDARQAILTVRDQGRPFPADSYSPPDLDTPREGGYGVHLMNSLMDGVSRTVDGDGWNVLELRRRRRPL